MLSAVLFFLLNIVLPLRFGLWAIGKGNEQRKRETWVQGVPALVPGTTRYETTLVRSSNGLRGWPLVAVGTVSTLYSLYIATVLCVAWVMVTTGRV